MTHLVLLALLLCLAGRAAALAAGATPPSLDTELLKFAPTGTWAVFFVDLKALRASPVAAFTLLVARGSPLRLENARAVATFVLPVEPPLGPPLDFDYCVIVEFEGGSQQEIEQSLAEELSKTAVEGQDAYEATGGVLFVVVDDSTVLGGRSPDTLAAILNAYKEPKGRGMVAPLQESVKLLAGSTAYGAAVLPDELSKMLPLGAREERPSYLGSFVGGYFAVKISEGVQARAALRFGNPLDAQQCLAVVKKGLNNTKVELKERAARDEMDPGGMIGLVLRLLDSVELDAHESELTLALAVGSGESQQLVALLAPVSGQPRRVSRKATSKHNLHNIGLGITIYRIAHEEQYPPDLEAVLEGGYLDMEEEFLDPSDYAPVQRGKKGLKYSYEYVGPIPKNAPPDIIICYGRKGIYPDGRTVLYVDNAVRWVSEDELHDPEGPTRTSLRACYTALMERFAGQLTEEQKTRLKKFYEIEE